MPGASDSLVGAKCLPEVGLCTGMPCWGAPIIHLYGHSEPTLACEMADGSKQ